MQVNFTFLSFREAPLGEPIACLSWRGGLGCSGPQGGSFGEICRRTHAVAVGQAEGMEDQAAVLRVAGLAGPQPGMWLKRSPEESGLHSGPAEGLAARASLSPDLKQTLPT